MTREFSIRLMNMMDDGIVNPMWLAEALVQWMAESDVKQFCLNELYEYFEVEECDEDA